MAKDDKTAEKPSNGNPTPVIPEGFQSIAPLEGAKWWKPTAGAILYGRLNGRFARRKGGAYFQIKAGDSAKLAQLLKKNISEIPAVMAVQGSGDDAEVVKVSPGDVVNFDERAAIEILAGYAVSDGVFDVCIHVTEKVKIPGTTHTFWRMTPSVLVVKAPTRPIVQPTRATESEEIPF